MAGKKGGQLTPLMQQYLEVKQETPGCLVLFRLGDFYECFFEDAKVVSKALDLVLTGRDCGLEERAPMCGVPYHAVEGYLQKLIDLGYKVAVCEQMEDPKQAVGLVKRAVTRIVTPGTNINAEHMDDKSNSYILAVNRTCDAIGCAICDITTGEFSVAEFSDPEKFMEELEKLRPAEIIVNEEAELGLDPDHLKKTFGTFISTFGGFHFHSKRAEETLLQHFRIHSLEGLGLSERPLSVSAAGALLDYFQETQKRNLTHITQISLFSTENYMMLDHSTRRNLELCETMREKSRIGSLLWVLDDTRTAMGGRMLKKWLEQPLIDREAIQKRLDAVECFTSDYMLSEELKELLSGIYDMERLMGRISYGSGGARDLLALKTSLAVLPGIAQILSLLPAALFRELSEEFDPLEDLYDLLEKAVCDDAPLTLHEGHLIKPGFSAEVDALREADTNGRKWLTDLEAREKEKTGIRTLKIGYNRVFGYYLEVSRSFMDQVPENYIRKQTLAGGERYITEELKKMEDTILGAKEKLQNLEYDLFVELRSRVAAQMVRIQKTAHVLACLDVIRSLASVAVRYQYVKPVLLTGPEAPIRITGGRHPVVERMLRDEAFIPNDTLLDCEENRILMITGPNMAGKSTYMRQTAVICLMAQIGSFVPCEKAELTVVDRIFTRVGASDDLGSGQSTFMVEMAEMSNILRHATRRSLLILDEIGRGTSTYDGLSIAWAVAEFIADPERIGAKTLFATHYHELTQLEGVLSGVKNYCVSIKEKGHEILFLRKIVRGFGDRSYGIEVARLAGLPQPVVERAEVLLAQFLEKPAQQIDPGKITDRPEEKKREASAKTAAESSVSSGLRVRESRKGVLDHQITLFGMGDSEKDQWIARVAAMNVLEMTPIQAMTALDELIRQAKEMN